MSPKPEHWTMEQYRTWLAGAAAAGLDPAPNLERAPLDHRAISEADLLAGVLEIAAATGWAAYHTHDSRRSPAGFPDLVLSRPPRLIFAELKSRTARPTTEQDAWLERLLATPTVEAYLWRPDDYPARILDALQHRAREREDALESRRYRPSKSPTPTATPAPTPTPTTPPTPTPSPTPAPPPPPSATPPPSPTPTPTATPPPPTSPAPTPSTSATATPAPAPPPTPTPTPSPTPSPTPTTSPSPPPTPAPAPPPEPTDPREDPDP